jgi:ribosomal protein S18 acetylase RimI-like enzyme
MSAQPFRLVLLDAEHDRKGFESGSTPLDRYLHEQVSQDVRRRVAACFVAVTNVQRVAGYYTLASASVELSDLPEATAKKLPRYPSVPAVRMGRLAVDRDFKGMGLGGALLADALRRYARAEIAAHALIVDAKDQTAADFYRHHGFIALPSSALRLFLPLATVAGLNDAVTSR